MQEKELCKTFMITVTYLFFPACQRVKAVEVVVVQF